MKAEKRPGERVFYKQHCAVRTLDFSANWTYRKIAEDQSLSLDTVFDIYQAPSTPRKPKGQSFSLDTPTRRQPVATATSCAATQRMPLREVAAACCLQACKQSLQKAF